MHSEPKIYVQQHRGYPSIVALEEMDHPEYVKGFYKADPEPTVGILPLEEEVDEHCYPVVSQAPQPSQRCFAVGWVKYEAGALIQPGTYDFTYDGESGLWTFTPEFRTSEDP